MRVQAAPGRVGASSRAPGGYGSGTESLTVLFLGYDRFKESLKAILQGGAQFPSLL